MKCPRVQCPPLECDEKVAFRSDKKACCKQCPTTTPRSNAVTTAASDTLHLPRDQALPSTRRTAEEILSSGGCKLPLGPVHENGMEWHPRVHSHGEMKCVKCRCKVRKSAKFWNAMKKYTHELIVIEIIRRLNSLSEISGCFSRELFRNARYYL